MARSTTPEKRPGFFSQLRTLFTFTRKAFPWLPYVLIGILVVGAAIGVGIGFLVFREPVNGWIVAATGATLLAIALLGIGVARMQL